jgi:uncharacterized RDD family membrane protein YckC
MTQTADRGETTYPAAELDRRFYAFAIDRLIAWTLYAGAGYLAYRLFFSEDETWAGVGLVAGVVVLVGLGFAVLLGVAGVSPGKAMAGLRVVHAETGTPIGVGRALWRTIVLGIAALPTFCLGVATLAWTAVMDPGGWRRGWHDHISRAVVVDIRPVPVEEEVEESRPRQIVNLTAMRLMPTLPEPPAPAPPPRAPRPEGPPTQQVAAPPAPAPVPPAPQPSASRPTAPHPPVPAPRAPAPPAPAAPPPPAPASAPPPPAAPPAAPKPAPRPAAPVSTPTPAAATAARWRVTFDTGETFVVEGLALVGRRPESRQGEPVRHLVALRSSDMSLSKTHAQFQVVPDGALVVMDRGSTNGSILLRKGVSKALSPGRPSTLLEGDKVRFGDREMTVGRED